MEHCIRFFNIKDPSEEQISKFTDMESNIWACIYRALNKKRDIAYRAYDLTYNSDSDEEEYKETIEEYKENISDILKKELKPRRSVNLDGKQISDSSKGIL